MFFAISGQINGTTLILAWAISTSAQAQGTFMTPTIIYLS
jgi:hypothetical protein